MNEYKLKQMENNEWWPWRSTHIDEGEWLLKRAAYPPPAAKAGWYLLGAVVGLLMLWVM